MKKFILGFCSVALVSNLAFAKEYKDDSINSDNKVYGRTKLYVGYDVARYDKNVLSEEYKARVNKGVYLGLGYNLYYKLDSRVHLFTGTDFQLRVNGKRDDFTSVFPAAQSDDGNVIEKFSIREIGRANLKFGAKFNIGKYVAIESYATGGAGALRFYNDSSFKTMFAYNVGIGTDVVFNDRFFIGAEYRYTATDNVYNSSFGAIKYKTYSILGKVGFQF